MNPTNIRSFIPMQKLGEGSFASVYKVKRISDQKIYALKKIKMNRLPQKAKESSLNEVRFLASFDSPFITKYYQAFFDQNLNVLCIVMEYAESGDIRKMIKSYSKQKRLITEIQIWKAMIHLIYGLKILHDNKILHRDIKCENILISEGKYKIGDMNVSKVNKYGFVETQTGTPYYASPQVWKDEPYNQKSDIWSLGCILYEMATLRPPFMGTSMEDLYKNILKGKYPAIPKCYSNQLSSIIQSCLKLTPKERPSALELLNNKTLRIYENICIQSKMPNQSMNVEMLHTICLPKNIKQLNKCLPKSNYETKMANQPQMLEKIIQFKSQNFACKQVKHQKKQIEVQPQSMLQEVDKKQSQTKPKQQLLISCQSQKLKQNCVQKINQELSNKLVAINSQKITKGLRSYSKKIFSTQKKNRRVLIQSQKQTNNKPKSRSRSLPRTERSSISQSKELITQKTQKCLQKMKIEKENDLKPPLTKKQDKNRYWNIISQAKKYLQKGLHKNRKIF